MCKIGILTFTYGDNYGQRLQNLAVQEILKGYGFDVYTIRQAYDFRHRLRLMKRKIKSIFNGMYVCEKEKHELFEEFNREYIKFYPQKISEKKMLDFPEKQFDFFVAGSDQIWSPYSDDVNPTLFLQFTIPDKRIALAPSVASEDIPQFISKKYGEYFKGFRYLSVREEKSAALIKAEYGLEADVLIDPTLMFPAMFWNRYARRPLWLTDEKYVLCYFLGSAHSTDVLKEYANNNHYVLIDLLSAKEYKKTGPAEFLYLIQNAKLVVTDSYHGSIFSLIFNVPLIVKDREGESVKMSSRFDTLYHKFELVNNNKTGLIEASNFENNLQIEKEKFREYLDKAVHLK